MSEVGIGAFDRSAENISLNLTWIIATILTAKQIKICSKKTTYINQDH
jgi:hypothetical protein